MFERAVSGSVLILAVLLIRRACRGKVSQRFQYALWLLVLVRLLLPFPLRESPISVMNAVPEETAQILEPVSGQPIDRPSNGDGVSPSEAAAGPAVVPPGDRGEAPQPAQTSQGSEPVTAVDWLNLIQWLGTAGIGLAFLAENLHCARQLRRNRTPFQGKIHGCSLPVYVAQDIPSPCLFGLFRPAIYLTQAAAQDEGAIPYILAHESTHYRHLDHIWPIFRALAAALYWWNPLVWLAAHCAQVDCELACDEGVLKALGEERRFEYGKTLVGLVAVKKSPRALFQAATTMTGSKRELKQRIDMIVKRPKTVLPILVCAVLAAVLAVGCTFTGAERGTGGQPPRGVSGVPALDDGTAPAQTQTDRQRRAGVYNFVLLGQDKESANTDMLLVVSYDAGQQKVGMVSIPPNTIVHRSWSPDLKINIAYAGSGPETLKQEIENTFGIPIDYYIHMDLDGLTVLVDTLGGVDVELPVDMDYDDPAQDLHIHYAQGAHHLDGEQTAQVLRYRKNNDGVSCADTVRTEVCRQVLVDLAGKGMNWTSLAQVQDFIEVFQQHVTTDLSTSDLMYFAGQAVGLDLSAGVTTVTLAGRGDGYYDGQNQWCYVFEAEDILPSLNAAVNPYTTDLTQADLDLPKASYQDGSQVTYSISGGGGTYQVAVETWWDRYDPRMEKITVDGPSGPWTVPEVPVGWYDSAQWHLDGQLLSISYYGRMWRNFVLLDVKNSQIVYDGTLSFDRVWEYFHGRGEGMNYQPSEYNNFINMELEQMVDADTLVIRYELDCDTDGYTQSGTFRCQLSDGTLSSLQEEPPFRKG